MKLLTAIITLVSFQSVALADWWAPPQREIITASNGNFLLEVIPDKDGDYAAETKPCEAVFFAKRTGRQEGQPVSYAKQARFQLLNKRAPAALVADSGEHFVTFDE